MRQSLSLKQTRKRICILLIALSTVALVWRAAVHVSAQTSTVIFSDTFDDNTRDTTKWNLGVLSQPSSTYDSRVVVRELNQRLEITPLARVKDQNFNGYISIAAFNLTNARATVEVPQVPIGSSALAIFAVAINSNNWFRIAANSNTISFQQKINGTIDSVDVSYNAAQHHFWRVRHDAASGNIVFETSGDAATWTTRRTVTPRISITAMRIELNGGTSGSVNAPGTVIFNNLVLDSPTGTPTPTPTPSPSASPTPTPTPTPIPTPTPTPSPSPTAVFGDDFNDNLRDLAQWNLGVLNVPPEAYNPNVSVIEQNQRLEITPLANTSIWSHNGYVSAGTFNLTDAYATVEVPQVPNGSALAIFAVGIDSNNWYRISARSGLIFFQDIVSGVKNSVSITYNAAQHHYWRIRHNSGSDSITFETSGDGTSWTVQRTVPRQLAIAAMHLELDAGTYEAVSAPGIAIFDNFRLESSNSTQVTWTKRNEVVNDNISTHRYSHPQPFELDNGELIAGFSTNEDSSIFNYKLIRSPDGGNTWTSKATIASTGNNVYEGSFAQTSATNLVLVYGDGEGVASKRSKDRGATWGSAVTIAVQGGGADCHPSVTNLGNNILLVTYRYNDKILAKKSTDGGATWGSAITVASNTLQPYNSPSVVRMPSGNLVLAFSSGTGGVQFPHIYLTRSIDSGTTWSAPVSIKAEAQYSFNDPNLTVLNNGDLLILIVNGAESSGTRWDTSMLSHDEGQTWGCDSMVYSNGDPHRLNGIQLRNNLMILLCASKDGADSEYHITSLTPPANWPTNQCPSP
jgi:hypothetical protein